MNYIDYMKSVGIHIKKENRGKFERLKNYVESKK